MTASPSPPPADQVEAAQVPPDSCPACGALPCDWVDDPHKRTDELEGNDVWEILFGLLKGDVPDEMTPDVCEGLLNGLREASGGVGRGVAALRPVAGVAPAGMREALEGVGACAKCGSDHLYWRPGIPLSCAVCMTAAPDAILAALPPSLPNQERPSDDRTAGLHYPVRRPGGPVPAGRGGFHQPPHPGLELSHADA